MKGPQTVSRTQRRRESVDELSDASLPPQTLRLGNSPAASLAWCLAFVIATLTAFAGCGAGAGIGLNGEPVSSYDKEAFERLSSADTWYLTKLTVGGEEVEVPREANPTISFRKDEFSGNASCNHISGAYTARDNGKFSCESLMSTEMGCNFYELEMQVTETLLKVTQFDCGEGELRLLDGTGDFVLVFSDHDQHELPLQQTIWTLTHFTSSDDVTSSAESLSSGMQVTLVIEETKVSGKLAEGRYAADVDVTGNALAFSNVTLIDDDSSEGKPTPLSRYLKTLEEIEQYSINRNRLVLSNASGTVGLQLECRQPVAE